jgi:hypothetical protein
VRISGRERGKREGDVVNMTLVHYINTYKSCIMKPSKAVKREGEGKREFKKQ